MLPKSAADITASGLAYTSVSDSLKHKHSASEMKRKFTNTNGPLDLGQNRIIFPCCVKWVRSENSISVKIVDFFLLSGMPGTGFLWWSTKSKKCLYYFFSIAIHVLSINAISVRAVPLSWIHSIQMSCNHTAMKWLLESMCFLSVGSHCFHWKLLTTL